MDSSRTSRSSPGQAPAAPRRALLLLFLLSGAAALIYEVLWLKELGLPVYALVAEKRPSPLRLDETPPELDPYLAGVDLVARRQVRAGLAYYQFTTLRRMGRAAEAEEALLEYRALLARP